MRALAPHWAALAVRAAGGRWAPPVPPRRGRSGPGPPAPREWALPVSPRGRLRVRLPCQVTVRPLDPQRWPGADRVLVAVSGGSPAPRGREREPVRVEHDEALGQVAIVADGVDSKAAVDVRTPVKFGFSEPDTAQPLSGSLFLVSMRTCKQFQSENFLVNSLPLATVPQFNFLLFYHLSMWYSKVFLQFINLDIKTSGTGCVKIQKIECDNCKIETEKGTSVLQSIKSHKIDIRTNGGKVIGLGTLYGNTDICATEKGSVNIEKLQGTTINISTEDGLLKTKYLYAESSSLSSVAGDIMLGSVHGSITVKVPASLKAYLELSGRKVDVNSEIQLKETQRASKDDHVTISGIRALAMSATAHLQRKAFKVNGGVMDLADFKEEHSTNGTSVEMLKMVAEEADVPSCDTCTTTAGKRKWAGVEKGQN
ncbi:protein FAM185A [Pitangus sulphuratus]|nr:protein FAM185A [Pitangus sulphuratus]